MLLSFLRHAEAENSGGPDSGRRLSPKGTDQAGRVGRFLRASHLIPEIILTSPVLRARQTAEIVAGVLGAPCRELPWLACGMEPDVCLERLSDFSGHEHILLIGHEPDLSQAIAHLIGLSDPSAIKIRKASLSGVEIADLHAGCGLLHFCLPVRLMHP